MYDDDDGTDILTVVIGDDAIYNMSASTRPSHPCGVNQFVGQKSNPFAEFRSDFGEPVEWDTVPDGVKEAIEERR